MNISVGNINPLNPDVNICSLMQLIGMGVAEQTTEKESCDENGNSFIRMMQQTLSELLQYDYSDQSTETGSSLQVSESLDQIHQETSTAEETQMTPGYAMIMPFGKTDRFAQAKVQEMPMVEMEVAKNKTTDLPTQVTAQVVATVETKETLAAKPEAAPVIRQTGEARPQEVHQQRQAPESITEPTPIRNASAHVLSGYEEVETVEPQEPLAAKPEAAAVIRQTVEVRPQEVHQQRQAPENTTEPTPIRNASAHVLSGYEEIATVEPQEPLAAKPEAAPVIRQTGEARTQEVHQHRQAPENITEPSPIRNASAPVLEGLADVELNKDEPEPQQETAKVFPGQAKTGSFMNEDGRKETGNHTKPAEMSSMSADDPAIHSHKETKTSSANPFFVQDDRNDLKMNAVLQEKTGQKQENAMSGDQETSFTDKQQAQVRHDAKNFAEKNAPAGTEFSAVIGKMKMENKAKVLPGDKNPEMNISGSTMTAGGSSRAVGTEMNPSQIINRVASEFRENLSNEGGRIKIILAPPSLGTLEMDVAVYHSKVRVILTAENQDVQKMLSGNIDALKGALQNQGLNIDRCDVLTQDRKEQFAQNSGQEAFQRESDRRGQNESNEYRRGETTELLARKVTLLQSDARRSGKISLFA